MDYKTSLELYDSLIKEAGFKRKGKTMPYTSDFGHMFTLLNKDGEIGIRFSKEVQQKYFDTYNTSYFISYGAKMKGYILIHNDLLNNRNLVIKLIQESYDYISTLDPK